MTTMLLDPFIKNLLELFIEDIENNEFENIYSSIPVRQADLTGQLTDVLLKVGCNPLEHLLYVPSNYLNSSSRTHIDIPDGIKYINDGAFFNSNLESIVLPKSVDSLGLTILQNSHRLRSVDMSQSQCQVISYGCCFNCYSLKEFKLPRMCTSVDGSAFWNCSKLEELQIDRSIDYVVNNVDFKASWTNRNKDTIIKCIDGTVLVDMYGNKQRQE